MDAPPYLLYPSSDALGSPGFHDCLIHLIRELNDELRGSPFDEEFMGLAMSFADLLKGIAES
jgi:hypothetical protein